MNYVSISVADLRAQPKFESERVSQLVYGEKVTVLEEQEEFLRVKGVDGYPGYIKKAIVSTGREKTHKLTRRFRSYDKVFPFGSYVNREDVNQFGIPVSIVVPIARRGFDICKISRKFMGIPYLWGGTSDFGYDCSGLVQRLYRFNGVELPRDADEQRDFLPEVESFGDAKSGDLVFFEGHVGMLLGGKRIIHANGKYASVSITDLGDGSDYSKFLMNIFEKIGRVPVD